MLEKNQLRIDVKKKGNENYYENDELIEFDIDKDSNID